MFKADDWRTVRVHQGLLAFNRCVQAAVHFDAGTKKRKISMKRGKTGSNLVG